MKKIIKILSFFYLVTILISKTNIKAEMVPFNLGEVKIHHKKQIIPLELAGVLSVSENEGEIPIVFIIPDINVTQDTMQRYYGFLNELTEVPALGVLLDLSPLNEIKGVDEDLIATIFDYYRFFLNRAVQGESLAFGRDLFNKGDFSKVIILGCGESVDGVYRSIEKLHEKQMSFAGAMLIDPRRSKEVPNIQLPDIPTTIVLPYTLLQKNAISLSLFEANRKEKNRQSMTSMIYVQQDTDLMNASELEYIQFVNKYALSYIQNLFQETSEMIGFSALETAPQTLFDTTIKSSLSVPEALVILNPRKEKNPHLNVLGGNNRFINLSLNHYRGLVDTYKLNWENKASRLEIELPEEYRDISSFHALSLYINYHNERNQPLSFIIEFCDMEGQSQQVEIENMQPLNYISGTAIPFYNERVVLKELMKVDTTSIRYINLIFKEMNNGELNIGDISLIKGPKCEN